MSNEARTKQGESGTGLTNEQLAARIQAGENVSQNMARLYSQVKGFIHSIAWKYRGCGVELEDLAQEGFLALYDAVDGYDCSQGAGFLTYAGKWIHARIAHYIRANGSSLRLPYHSQEKQRKYIRFCSAFEMEYGRRPTEAEAARILGITLEQARQARESAYMSALVSLDSPVTGTDGGENTTAGEMVPSARNLEEEVLERVQQEELSRVLWDCVDSLPDKYPEVIRRRYQGGQSLRQIGEAVGVSTERVRQMEGKALRELRAPSKAKRLRPFLPEADRVYSEALKGGGAAKFGRTWTSSTERVALELVESTEAFLKREREETERLLAEAGAEMQDAAARAQGRPWGMVTDAGRKNNTNGRPQG